MNDDEFGRSVFAEAREACLVDEPSTLPDVELIRGRARRRAGLRRGVITGGTVALAGIVTAGIVMAPSLFSGGVPEGPGLAPGATTDRAPATTSPVPTKTGGSSAGSGTTCTHQPIDLTAILDANLPRGITASADATQHPDGVTCVEYPGGGWEMLGSYTLSTPSGILAIQVMTGDRAVKTTPAAAASEGPSSADVSRLRELKRSLAAQQAPPETQAQKSGSPAGAAHSSDSMQANKSAKIAAANAAGHSARENPVDCGAVVADTQLCHSAFTKGSDHGIDVTLTRKASSPVHVDVMAGSASPTVTQPPLSVAQLTTIARAIAAAL